MDIKLLLCYNRLLSLRSNRLDCSYRTVTYANMVKLLLLYGIRFAFSLNLPYPGFGLLRQPNNITALEQSTVNALSAPNSPSNRLGDAIETICDYRFGSALFEEPCEDAVSQFNASSTEIETWGPRPGARTDHITPYRVISSMYPDLGSYQHLVASPLLYV